MNVTYRPFSTDIFEATFSKGHYAPTSVYLHKDGKVAVVKGWWKESRKVNNWCSFPELLVCLSTMKGCAKIAELLPTIQANFQSQANEWFSSEAQLVHLAAQEGVEVIALSDKRIQVKTSAFEVSREWSWEKGKVLWRGTLSLGVSGLTQYVKPSLLELLKEIHRLTQASVEKVDKELEMLQTWKMRLESNAQSLCRTLEAVSKPANLTV